MPFDEKSAVTVAALYGATKAGLQPSPNSSVFRYVGMRTEAAWQSLEVTVLQNRLALSPSVSLNDPFEASPILLNGTTTDELQTFLRRLSMPPDSGIPIHLTKLSVVREGKLLSAAELTEYAQNLLEGMIAERNQKCHVGSFSRRISSELQWSHYANGYKGIAYHFAPSGSPESGFWFLKPVRYTRQRPIIFLRELIEQLSSDETTNAFTLAWLSFEQRSFLTKSTDWSYEEEERVIKQNVSEMSFHDAELVSIIVGPRFNEVDRLKQVVAKRSRPLGIYRASPSKTDYSIEIDWYNPL